MGDKMIDEYMHDWEFSINGSYCLKCGVGDGEELALADDCPNCIIFTPNAFKLCELHAIKPCLIKDEVGN